MIALGGMHSIWGALVGTILITFMSLEWLHYFQEYEIIVYGAILIMVIIFLPHGLVGLPETLRDKLRRLKRWRRIHSIHTSWKSKR